MSPKPKLNKTYSGTIDYGETYQYKDAKYWVYLRKRSSSQPIVKIWQVKIKTKEHQIIIQMNIINKLETQPSSLNSNPG